MGKAYIETDTLTSWKTQMESLNETCVQCLNNIKNDMKNLNSSYQGDYADKFEENFSNYTSKVINSHNDFADLENFLNTVVNVMEGH